MAASGGGLMAASLAAQGMSSVGNSYAQSQALRARGDYQKMVGQSNAHLAQIQASDAIDRGNLAAEHNQDKTRQLVGAQRASMAAQGVDVNTGSAANLQSDSETLGALDSMTLRNNAIREAYGYKVQSINDTFSGNFSQVAANAEASDTLLTGGMNAIGDFGKAGYYGAGYGK